MANYLVTGAAGFIGAATTQRLLDAGHTVIGVDNLNEYYDPRLKRHRLDSLLRRPNFHYLTLDIEQESAVNQLFASHRFDAVINLAARAGVRYSLDNPQVYFTTNVMGSLYLLENMRRHGVNKYVLASSSSLYNNCSSPFREDMPTHEPASPYAASKKAAEVQAYVYHFQYGIDISVLRFFTVYGPAGRPDMSVFRFIKWIDTGHPVQLFGDGSQQRDFTFVDDIVDGIVSSLQPLGFQIINLGGGRRPVSMSEMISLIEQQLGRSAIIQQQAFNKADMHYTAADISKAKQLLEWQSKSTFEAGLAETIAWYRANRDWVVTLRE
jgi:nucleoside-diphosphate-sugar epimerase